MLIQSIIFLIVYLIGPLPYGMDFLIKDNKTSDILLLGDKDWIHVYASDDPQFLVEVSVVEGMIYY